MYEPEMFSSFYFGYDNKKIETTPDIQRLSKIFGEKIDFQKFSGRALNFLKKYGCETVGEAYYCVLEHGDEIGRETEKSILYYVMEHTGICNGSYDIRKAFEMSREASKEIPKANNDWTDYGVKLTMRASQYGILYEAVIDGNVPEWTKECQGRGKTPTEAFEELDEDIRYAHEHYYKTYGGTFVSEKELEKGTFISDEELEEAWEREQEGL